MTKHAAQHRPAERKPVDPLFEGTDSADKGRKFEPFYIAPLGHDRRVGGRARRFDQKR
jgi:hypothetical protein